MRRRQINVNCYSNCTFETNSRGCSSTLRFCSTGSWSCKNLYWNSIRVRLWCFTNEDMTKELCWRATSGYSWHSTTPWWVTLSWCTREQVVFSLSICTTLSYTLVWIDMDYIKFQASVKNGTGVRKHKLANDNYFRTQVKGIRRSWSIFHHSVIEPHQWFNSMHCFMFQIPSFF